MPIVLVACCVHLSEVTFIKIVHTQVREWLFTIGYTLAYGAMLAKLWRVYKIFHNPAPNKRVSLCTLDYLTSATFHKLFEAIVMSCLLIP